VHASRPPLSPSPHVLSVHTLSGPRPALIRKNTLPPIMAISQNPLFRDTNFGYPTTPKRLCYLQPTLLSDQPVLLKTVDSFYLCMLLSSDTHLCFFPHVLCQDLAFWTKTKMKSRSIFFFAVAAFSFHTILYFLLPELLENKVETEMNHLSLQNSAQKAAL
jgi:hypothetical protein